MSNVQTMARVVSCDKVACYNAGNGRECVTVIHRDGSRSFEWKDHHEARAVARNFKSADDIPYPWRTHTISMC